MPRVRKSLVITCVAVLVGLYLLAELYGSTDSILPEFGTSTAFSWKRRRPINPVGSYIPLPASQADSLPRIQHAFEAETAEEKATREERLAAVKKAFDHAWSGYKDHAWGEDEVAPLDGEARSVFGGWAATLVDSLDTLWIMGMRDEFRAAVQHVARTDFTQANIETINVFEVTIRFLGGMLSAHDLSGDKALLRKAVELGDMLHAAFDTPSHMPVARWRWAGAKAGAAQDPGHNAVSAEVGSYSLEFSRLSQLTGDPKYFDAIQRVTDELRRQQNLTMLPGMWPLTVDPSNANFTQGWEFSVSAMADSLYEYLPKAHLLLGGGRPDYLQMYRSFLEPAKKHIFYRALNPDNKKIRFAGHASFWGGDVETKPEGQHLGCFVGGMVAIGAKLRGAGSSQQAEELQLARELTDGCIWAYASMPSGIMPEVFSTVLCEEPRCEWSDAAWYDGVGGGRGQAQAESVIARDRLPPGFSSIGDKSYQLRPEAIESVFVLHRATGDPALMDRGWDMFRAVEAATRTDIAYTELRDVTVKEPPRGNKMESYWTAETLKYYYLLFSDPGLVSLDEFVFNTEAHPFRYRKAQP